MKTKKNITVFQCDFCSKKLFREHAMVNHEEKCPSNPLNIRACFDCEHLETVDMEFETRNDDMRKGKCFFCKATGGEEGVFMHPPKLEYNENGVPAYVTVKGDEIIQEKMPVICSSQKPILF